MNGVRGRVLLLCLICMTASASSVTPQSSDRDVVVDPRHAGCGDEQLAPVGGVLKQATLGTFSSYDCDGAPRDCP